MQMVHWEFQYLIELKIKSFFVYGKVESGTVKIGSKLVVLPRNKRWQVVTIFNSKNEQVRYAKPGENIQIKLRMIENENDIKKGDMFWSFNELAPVSDLLEVELSILSLPKNKPIMTSGYKCIMHLHTISEEIIIKKLIGVYELDKNCEEYLKKNPQMCKPGCKVVARISTRIPICFEKFENNEHLASFTLRDEGKTIAWGKILKYSSKIQSENNFANKINSNITAESDINSSINNRKTSENNIEEEKIKTLDILEYDPETDEINTSSTMSQDSN